MAFSGQEWASNCLQLSDSHMLTRTSQEIGNIEHPPRRCLHRRSEQDPDLFCLLLLTWSPIAFTAFRKHDIYSTSTSTALHSWVAVKNSASLSGGASTGRLRSAKASANAWSWRKGLQGSAKQRSNPTTHLKQQLEFRAPPHRLDFFSGSS